MENLIYCYGKHAALFNQVCDNVIKLNTIKEILRKIEETQEKEDPEDFFVMSLGYKNLIDKEEEFESIFKSIKNATALIYCTDKEVLDYIDSNSLFNPRIKTIKQFDILKKAIIHDDLKALKKIRESDVRDIEQKNEDYINLIEERVNFNKEVVEEEVVEVEIVEEQIKNENNLSEEDIIKSLIEGNGKEVVEEDVFEEEIVEEEVVEAKIVEEQTKNENNLSEEDIIRSLIEWNIEEVVEEKFKDKVTFEIETTGVKVAETHNVYHEGEVFRFTPGKFFIE